MQPTSTARLDLKQCPNCISSKQFRHQSHTVIHYPGSPTIVFYYMLVYESPLFCQKEPPFLLMVVDFQGYDGFPVCLGLLDFEPTAKIPASHPASTGSSFAWRAKQKAPQGYRLCKRRLRAPTRDTFAYAKRLREESRKDLFH